ncbi:NAD(P)-binding protein [Dendrothele bispora CBS 962.96]|uniref:NAD(P)-binding protein n=1 Tax=Dendrothele bispora (strain CBS 962.96) TaxID=1314807 RepID=A0A4S8LXL2_DENBC|nr:NAD(P)-binding protein [Dendrothele bispora CBS 962.96]
MIETVFVTGATGFVGSHVVKALLDRGHNVIAAARGSKAEHLKKSCDKYAGRLRVVEVVDLAKDNLEKELVGITALIHVATPSLLEMSLEELIPATIESNMNIIRQAEKAGAKSIVVTGSAISTTSLEGKASNTTFNPITKEEALASQNPLMAYAAGKKYAEMAIWEWSETHPDVEVTILYPPWVFGPYVPDFYPVSPKNLSTSKYLYGLVDPNGKCPWNAFFIDVRDLANAHVNALKSPPASKIGRKRVVIGSPELLDGRKALATLAEKRPQLASRLNQKEPPVNNSGKYECDFARIEEVVGIKETDFLPLEQTILDTIDDYISLEEQWIKEGHDVSIKVDLPDLVED